MVNPFHEKAIGQLADKYAVSKEEVRKAVGAQFSFVVAVARRDQGDSVRLPYFGIFKHEPKRKERYDKARALRKQQGVHQPPERQQDGGDSEDGDVR